MQRSTRALPVALFLLAATAAPAETQTYRIEPAEAETFELRVHKTGLMSGKTHVFVFDRYEGELRYDPDDPSTAQVEFTVESDSIRCLDDWVNEKERGKILQEARENMLAVDRYPQMRFEADGLERRADGGWRALGALTIRGQAKPAAVDVELTPAGDHLTLEGSATVSLKDYGLDPPSAAFGLVGTKSEMDLRFALRAAPAKE